MSMRQRPQDFLSMPVGQWFHSWQLVWREDCHDDHEYNPCSSLLQKYQ